jgi:hypothetical protein
VRAVARHLGEPPSTTQRRLERMQKRLNDERAEPGNVIAAVDDELTCDDVETPFEVGKLSVLELYRLRHVPDLPTDIQTALASAWLALPREPVTYPITDDGPSWREGVARAMGGDTSSPADDDW